MCIRDSGNLDYEIDYNSKNELGQTVESFNQMRRRLKHYIDKQNKAEEERKELIAGIAHDVSCLLYTSVFCSGAVPSYSSRSQNTKFISLSQSLTFLFILFYANGKATFALNKSPSIDKSSVAF